MEIEKDVVYLTVSCGLLCEAPERFSGYDLKITPPFDGRLASAVERLFGGVACAIDDGGNEISLSDVPHKTRWIYIKQPNFLRKKSYSFNDVIDILSALRGENGCPWDRAQTHESIRSNLIEEAYELVDAIDRKDNAKIIEETGDLLLQAVFHMTIAREAGEFDFGDVYDALCTKLITRHTHIFGGDTATNSEEALASWEKNKLREKSITSVAQNMNEVPQGMPALLRAYKVAKRAAKGNLVVSDIDKTFELVPDKLRGLKSEFLKGGEVESAVGEALFELVNLFRLIGAEPEIALNKYIGRFVSDAVEKEKNCGWCSKDASEKK